MAALLYALLPVVVCMAHEAKPHLPGAVLMLAAVLFGMRYAETGRGRDWWAMCLSCGASLGMVLSALPIFVVIPVAEWVRQRQARSCHAVRRIMLGVVIGAAVYAATNPYVPINLFVNRDVLASNLGNSTAMYEMGRLGAGIRRMIALTVEGATLPVVILGTVGLTALAARSVKRDSQTAVLMAPVVLFFGQFVLIGAGKPAEYGRFGLFVDIVLAVGAAYALTRPWPGRLVKRGAFDWVPAAAVVVWMGFLGGRYLYNFARDASLTNTRLAAAETLFGSNDPIGVLADPAPYSLPPIDFARREVWLFDSSYQWREALQSGSAAGRAVPHVLISPRDGGESGHWEKVAAGPEPTERASRGYVSRFLTRISWANKPICWRRMPADP